MSNSSITRSFALSVLIGSTLLVSTSRADHTSSGDKVLHTQLGFTPSATDIGNVGNPALTSRSEAGYTPFTSGAATSTPAALNDGVIGLTTGQTDPDLGTIAFDLDGTWTTTYAFNTTLSPLGYDISSIVSIAAWGSGRTNQNYQVQYTTVNHPAPQTLDTFVYSPTLTDADGDSTALTISDSAGPGVTIGELKGVTSLIFNIMKPTVGVSPETVYREIDINGQATVAPEPSMIAMSLAAMVLGSGRFMRRSRKQ